MRRGRVAVPAVAGVLAAAGTFAALERDEPDRAPASRAPAPQAGRVVFARMGCASCHTLSAAGSQGRIGPSLDERLPSHTPASLRRRIVQPYPPGTAESYGGMPRDYGRRLTRRELDALVGFLLDGARRRGD